MKYIALLIVFSYSADGLDHKYSMRIAGYDTLAACEAHRVAVVRQLTADPNIEVEQQSCFEGFK